MRVLLKSVENFKFSGFWLAVRDSAYAILLLEIYTLFRIQTKDYFNLKIIRKRRSSIDLNIHNSKVFSSEHIKWESESVKKEDDYLKSERDCVCKGKMKGGIDWKLIT